MFISCTGNKQKWIILLAFKNTVVFSLATYCDIVPHHIRSHYLWVLLLLWLDFNNIRTFNNCFGYLSLLQTDKIESFAGTVFNEKIERGIWNCEWKHENKLYHRDFSFWLSGKQVLAVVMVPGLHPSCRYFHQKKNLEDKTK